MASRRQKAKRQQHRGPTRPAGQRGDPARRSERVEEHIRSIRQSAAVLGIDPTPAEQVLRDAQAAAEQGNPVAPRPNPAMTIRPEAEVRDLLTLADMEHTAGDAVNHLDPEHGTFLAVLKRPTAETIQDILAGVSVTNARRLAAAGDWRDAIESERDHLGSVLDKMEVIREWRLRQVARLDSLVMDAELGNAFLPPSGQIVRVIDGRLRRAALQEPNLQAAADAVRRYFGADEAKAIFRDVLAVMPEGAFTAEYLDALRAAVLKRHPEVANIFAAPGAAQADT